MEEDAMFEQVDSRLDFPKLEQEVLDLWEREGAFGKLREKNSGHEPWSFIDGPITANNPMGVHHAWGRTYKDIFQRWKAMQGFDQRYQNGFDCHGLWVEVEVEKELGLNSKREIRDYGIANFVRRCRERVERFSALQTEQSRRLGQWMDWADSYYTMSDTNIEHIWHFLKTCHERGWLYRGRRAMPWCARCGTSLSQHELVDSYRDLKHTSVYVKLPLVDRPGEFILVWTTTPWTLAANTALAVHPQIDYKRVRDNGDVLYVAEGALEHVTPSAAAMGSVKGSDLVGLRYLGPFHDLPVQQGLQTPIVAWEDVGEDEGTGVVHIAPGCGEEDFALSQVEDLPVLTPIDEGGVYVDGYGWLTGKSVSDVAPLVFDSLREKGMLYRTEEYEHRYPVCWRCGEELVFRLVDEWFLSCGELREPMIRAARQVRWEPDYAGKRMDDWLNNMGDWCISRKRFWGLPLPFYICACGEVTVVGSRQELDEMAVGGTEGLPELHRPWIDDVLIRCPKCGSEVERVPEVGDCWLDAGIVPFSTLHWLDAPSYWEKWFPAAMVVEMREQIRLWFYSLLFMSVAMAGRAPYESALVYEKVHDEKGRPMHKSWGNAIWFDDAVERMGADVMRWLYASANLQTNLNFGYSAGKEVVRKLLTLWNVYSFLVTYARVDGWTPGLHPAKPCSDLDRWILSRLNGLLKSAQESLENMNALEVTRQVDEFVDDLSNWYVRLSRRRFWKSESDEDKESAYSTLYEVLVTLAKLLAPILPFLSEAMYQNLVRSANPNAPVSVHLCDWPLADESRIDPELMAETEAVMRVVRLGRSARNDAGVKVRQPLSSAYVEADDSLVRRAVRRSSRLIAEELNVKSVALAGEINASGLISAEEQGTVVWLDTTLTDALVAEGMVRDLVRHIQNLRKQSGFQVDDHVTIRYAAVGPLADAIKAHTDYIRQETLADSLAMADSSELTSVVRVAGEEVSLRLTASRQ